jgi:hypothetical protein
MTFLFRNAPTTNAGEIRKKQKAPRYHFTRVSETAGIDAMDGRMFL